MPATDPYVQTSVAVVPFVVGSDAERCWLAGIQARDREALEQIYCTYSGPVMHFLALVEPGRPPLETCLDVFEELWHSAAAADPGPGELADSIFALAYRVLLERAPSSCPANSRLKPGCDVWSVVGALTWEQRVIVALVYGLHLPADRISKITAMTDDEIAAHLNEARNCLRHELLSGPGS
jgi:hypothetical protein